MMNENLNKDIQKALMKDVDLSPEEYASARAAGFLPTRLGNFVLRVPTAALYCLAAADQMRANF